MRGSVLVTGGSGGIGAAIVRRLHAAGSRVTFTYNAGEDRANALVAETGATPQRLAVEDPATLEALAKVIEDGSFEGLVLAHGGPISRGRLVDADIHGWAQRIAREIELAGRLSQALARTARRKRLPGAIVVVLSQVVLGLPPEKMGQYATVKHALLGLTLTMAAELGRHGVRVNAVSPGMTRTSMIADLPDKFIEMRELELPLRRIAQPDEVAAVVEFLLSPAASYLNGVNLPVTGGLP